MKHIKKISIILFVIMILSAILTMYFDNTHIERIFRTVWISLMFICTILFGVYQIFVKQNKIAGYCYFALAFIFFVVILSVYFGLV